MKKNYKVLAFFIIALYNKDNEDYFIVLRSEWETLRYTLSQKILSNKRLEVERLRQIPEKNAGTTVCRNRKE